MMKAGQFNSPITIQQLDTNAGADELGQPIRTWANVGDDWADIRYLSGLEAVKAGAEASISRVSVRVRYRTDLNAGMRLTDGESVYNIRVVQPDRARREYVDLVCEVVT